jgi:flagellar protein FliL
MSEEKEKGKAKKGGKLPLIAAVVAILGAGGFFGMKARGGEKEQEVKLGQIELLEEFLVPLRGGRNYIRTEIALHMQEGFSKDTLGKNISAVRNEVIDLLSVKSVDEVSSLAGKAALRKAIAQGVNKVLTPPDTEDEEDKDKKKKKKKKSEEDDEPDHPDWDSQTGPVLKVYFHNFATQ